MIKAPVCHVDEGNITQATHPQFVMLTQEKSHK